jgi:4-hydroxy-4-methyl-2-oxoglutarate aldolase
MNDILSLMQRIERLYTPILLDVMDSLGLGRGFLGEPVQHLFRDPFIKVCGPAFPVRVARTTEYVEIDNLLRMVDAIPRDAMVVVAAGENCDCALWGGLMSAGARRAGARGAVVNGAVRDVAQIAGIGFPVFGVSRNPQDIRRRAMTADFDCEVDFFGVRVRPGDLVFGDADGVIVLPSDRAEEIVALAENGVRDEVSTRASLERGEKAEEVFRQFGRF